MTTKRLGALGWVGLCLLLAGCSSESPPAGGDGGSQDRGRGEGVHTGDGATGTGDGPTGTGDGPIGTGDGPIAKADGPASKNDGTLPTADTKPTLDTGPPSCGPGFTATFTAQQELTLHTASGTVSYDGASQVDPLSSNKRGALAANTCGEAGLVYRAVTGTACELVYARFTKAGFQEKSAVISGASSSLCPTDAALFYDAACKAQVIVRKSGTELSQYALDAQKKWQATTVTLAPLTGHTLSALLALTRGRDGKMHVLLKGYQAGTGGGERILHGTLQSGATWSFAVLPAIAFSSVHEHHSTFPYNVLFHFAVDSKGEVHAVFNNDAELGYAVSSAGAWKQEIVVKQADNRSNGGFDASLTLGANDQPLIAGSSSTHYVGWSIKSLKLQLHSRTGGTWTSELIADTADGYVGGDGNKYTGNEVQVFVSSLGHPHVVWSDLASWHITYNYRSPGQIRHAIKACGTWHHHTPFKQKGQTASPNPIYSCRNPMGALLSDGQSLLFACMERILSSAKPGGETNVAFTANLRTFGVQQVLK